ncbi:MAG: ribonuclease P protein component [Dehalococcoidia bacterium]
MRRDHRLRRKADIDLVYREGRVVTHPLLVVRTRPNGLERFRFTAVVGKRVGNAVTRNRVRRRLREIVRQVPVAAGVDLIVGARAGAEQASFADLAAALGGLLRRAKALGGVPADRQMATFPS